MAQERFLTPEKQLLKLIEEPNLKGEIETRAIKHQGLSLFSLGAWSGRISFFSDWLGGLFKASGYGAFNFKIANNILALCVCVLGAYFIQVIYAGTARLNKGTEFEAREIQAQAESASTEDVIAGKDAAYFLEKIRAKDIFRMGGQKALASQAAPQAETPSKLSEAAGHLKLVGISWSNDPDAMIEDTTALRTFFIKRGQTIGEFKVQAIFKDKVILSYGGEEIELR